MRLLVIALALTLFSCRKEYPSGNDLSLPMIANFVTGKTFKIARHMSLDTVKGFQHLRLVPPETWIPDDTYTFNTSALAINQGVTKMPSKEALTRTTWSLYATTEGAVILLFVDQQYVLQEFEVLIKTPVALELQRVINGKKFITELVTASSQMSAW